MSYENVRARLSAGTTANDTNRIAGRNKWRRKVTASHEYLIESHEYQLSHGGVRIGAVVTMLGKEAQEKNRALEDKFKKQLDQGKTQAKLMRWVLNERKLQDPEFRKIMQENPRDPFAPLDGPGARFR